MNLATVMQPLSAWAPVVLLIVIGLLFAVGTVVASIILGPGRSGSTKATIYESGVVPVGDTQPRPIDVRIVSASNKDLDRMVAAGEFREDLLFRLNVVRLLLPPLRQRKEDIPLLVEHFLRKYTDQMGKHVPGVTNGAMRSLLNHEWRGNVRELENVIERAVIFADDRPISVQDLPFASENASDDVGEELKEALREFERQHIIATLRRHNYDKTEAAKYLSIGISSLYRKLDELEISKDLEEEDRRKNMNGQG